MTSSKIVGALITHIVQPLIMLMFIVAVVIFVWGVVEMIINAGNEEARAKGSKHMMWGLIGLFIMFGVYGVLNLLVNTLKVW
jgi:phosphotransferase system  glucose/maltose/N-acetylglucosamine-specific IIC component